ncbi:CHC2 zinc finger domain-containing protein [Caldicellulosiruptor changbaiensis]|uniref:CHC2 zinc finger domain-containing protein n=1 Tax=Caldicellulosiruptor changbaiensis TaxID=1222016 RepID=UPI001F499C28|nr:CHC2 zinc finger domain-containing protein [Caldicellulosiruptor changbaiensis]
MGKTYRQINIDEYINYERFYSKYLKNMKRTGTDKISAQCPFHDDQHPSFWFNINNGCWKCEAGCGSGNAVTFLARVEKISQKEAYKILLKEAGLFEEDKKKGKKMKYTLENYSKEEKLPIEFLTNVCNLKQEDYHKRFVSIYYKDEKGNTAAIRKRHHPQNKKRFS